MLTRQQQRDGKVKNDAVAVGLYCHLMNLLDDILAGDTSQLTEFQQFIQFAPESAREAVLKRLDASN